MYFAFGRCIDEADDIHERRFAAAGRPPYGEKFSRMDVQRDAVQCIDGGLTEQKAAFDVAQLQNRRGLVLSLIFDLNVSEWV